MNASTKKHMSRSELCKEGWCCGCDEKRHLASACKKGKKSSTNAITTDVPAFNSILEGHMDTFTMIAKCENWWENIPRRSCREQQYPERTENSIVDFDELAKSRDQYHIQWWTRYRTETATDVHDYVHQWCTSEDFDWLRSLWWFIGIHFVTINKLSIKKRDVSLPIQEAVKGSKSKSNAKATIKAKFGEWAKTLDAHATELAGYDAIVGTPTLHDGDAVIRICDRKMYFRAWDTLFHCTIPENPPKSPKKHSRSIRRFWCNWMEL